MKKQFLEIGQIVNTHGIKGEVKIVPWANSPDFLLKFKTLYLDNSPVSVTKAYVHGNNVIMKLDGIDNINDAMLLRNKILLFNRDDIKLPVGKYFLEDLKGLTAFDYDNGEEIGSVVDITTIPSGNIYTIKGKEKKYMVPAVDAFIKEIDIEQGFMKIHLLEGMDF